MPPPQLRSIDLNALITDVLDLYEGSRAQPTFNADAQLAPVSADGDQMRQVLHNLLRNAQDALAQTATPQISIETLQREQFARVTVSDNGSGFTQQTLARAFEPYVTTKARGTGLGLAIVKKIIDEHGGEIRISNRESGGAKIVIKLPLAVTLTTKAA